MTTTRKARLILAGACIAAALSAVGCSASGTAKGDKPEVREDPHTAVRDDVSTQVGTPNLNP
ncbi:MAG: hypothetical protein R3B49_01035 [Phycisphaerales bacterium]